MTYSCIECVDRPTFPSIPSLARHRNTTHPVRPLPKEPTMPTTVTDTICPDCGAPFRGEHGLAVHQRRTHGKAIKRPARPKLDPIDAALEPLIKRRNRIDEQLHDVTALETERDRLDRAIAALEAAR